MVSVRRLLKWAVLKKWTPRQGSPRNLGLAIAQLSGPIGILIAFVQHFCSLTLGLLRLVTYYCFLANSGLN